MRKLLFTLLLLLSIPAYSGETYLDATIASKHLSSDENLNEQNFGLGLTFKDDKWSYKAGYFKNSHNKTSIYAVTNYDFIEKKWFSIGLTAGLVSGYGGTDGQGLEVFDNVQVMALPNINFNINKFKINVGFIPMEVVTLQLGYKL